MVHFGDEIFCGPFASLFRGKAGVSRCSGRSGFHCPLFVLALLLFFNVAHAQPLSLCDYAPPRSELGDLNTVVNFRAFNSPGRDNTIYSGTFKLDGVYLYDAYVSGK